MSSNALLETLPLIDAAFDAEEEMQLCKNLAQSIADRSPYAWEVYRSGDAKEIMSQRAFTALETCIKRVEKCEDLEATTTESSEKMVVLGGSSSPANQTISRAATLTRGRKKVVPVQSRAMRSILSSALRSCRRRGVKLVEPSSDEDEDAQVEDVVGCGGSDLKNVKDERSSQDDNVVGKQAKGENREEEMAVMDKGKGKVGGGGIDSVKSEELQGVPEVL